MLGTRNNTVKTYYLYLLPLLVVIIYSISFIILSASHVCIPYLLFYLLIVTGMLSSPPKKGYINVYHKELFFSIQCYGNIFKIFYKH